MAKRSYDETFVYFAKTDETKILCPHFWEFKWAKGCTYNCQWCFLQGTFFGKKDFKPWDFELMKRYLIRQLAEAQDRRIYNTGELSDSYPSHPYMRQYMNIFEDEQLNPRGHKILLLTKSAEAKDMIDDSMTLGRVNTIYSASVNATAVSKRWELGAPLPMDRIRALLDIKQLGLGIETRARLDPVIPIEGWKQHYSEIIDALGAAEVDRVTVGTLRGLTRGLNFARKLNTDNAWTQYLTAGDTGWGKKMDDATRYEVNSFCIDRLKMVGIKEVGLCKETLDMAKAFNMDSRSMKCNCVW